jgi:hypothetical protein
MVLVVWREGIVRSYCTGRPITMPNVSPGRSTRGSDDNMFVGSSYAEWRKVVELERLSNLRTSNLIQFEGEEFF